MLRDHSILAALPFCLVACGGPDRTAPASADEPFPEVNFGMVVDTTPEFVFPRLYQLPPDTLPSSVDLSPWCPPPGNQHRQYSCGAWAWAYGVQSYCNNRRNDRKGRRTGAPDPDHVYSPSFLFNMYKQVGDTTPCSSGVADIDRFFKFSSYLGLCTMSQMPYDTAKTGCKDPVPPNTMAMGMSLGVRHALPTPVMLNKMDVSEWKHHLAQGEALLVLFVVDRTSFVDSGYAAARAGRPFTWSLKTFAGAHSGGHAMTCVGYDDADNTFLVMNSFGQDWGDRGYVRIPYSTLSKKCYGAYAFPIEGQGTNQVVVKPAADSLLLGPHITVALRDSQYVVINGLKVAFLRLTPNEIFANVATSQHGTTDPPNRVRMQEGETWTYYLNGNRIDLNYEKPSAAQAATGAKAVFTAHTTRDPGAFSPDHMH